MNRVFEDQLMDIQSDMISLSLEYVENKAEIVYICSFRGWFSFF